MSKQTTASDETEVKQLVRFLEGAGIKVRREKLSRGREYRVKSGNCQLSGERLLFVDRNLPASQQLSLIVDFIIDRRLAPASDHQLTVSEKTRRMLVQPSAHDQDEAARAAG